MDDINSSLGFQNKSSFNPINVRLQTEKKFNTLLKNALLKKKNNLNDNIEVDKLNDDFRSSTTASENNSENRNNKTSEIEIHGSSDNKSYIMNKFLNDAASIRDNSDESSNSCATYTKVPVPIPRINKKKVLSEDSSENTYTIEPLKNKENNDCEFNTNVIFDKNNESAADSTSSKLDFYNSEQSQVNIFSLFAYLPEL